MSDDWHSAYQSERLAHETTKKRLEELEDAIRERFESKVAMNTTKLEHQAIANSRERQEENRLRSKGAEFIDRNGGEAMG